MEAVVIGVGATLVMDAWALVLRRGFGVASLDFGMLGRWIGHLARGRVRHERIGHSAPIAHERAIGWLAHYTIGITFAAALLAVTGEAWIDHPSLAPALIVSAVTLAAPFLVLQPGMGLGIAASRAPHPNAARLRSVATHTVYGLGLYVSARLWSAWLS
ncbi:MAG: DUF2938 domain-containing protein [Vicinamibacterales bacterium]